jgi:hypothetical protein
MVPHIIQYHCDSELCELFPVELKEMQSELYITLELFCTHTSYTTEVVEQHRSSY